MVLFTYSSVPGLAPFSNTNSPIAHIPDDVLQEIFLLLAWNIDSPPISRRALKNGSSWFRMSAVTGAVSPWALYEESSLGMVREFLKRSRSSPLFVLKTILIFSPNASSIFHN
ncbi:hypothetical protein AcW1_006495 [Taiwanofungus camphoratus]|nr:hypothetical protein AcW1_006495 [Antrodia cinnamomea]